ncbi:MAG: FkbM family methyltransferase [Alphaproteobacteria bacterium]|nr:FkbM family methyltransferase [Alphaproteobacteria bacterium]
MPMKQVVQDTHYKKILTKNNLCLETNFTLIDVGCSGGIENYWIDHFDEDLSAIGFDPLITEIKRLNSESKNKKIQYVEAFIGAENQIIKEPDNNINNCWWERTSAFKAWECANYSIEKEVFNSGEDICYSQKKYSIDSFFKTNELDTIDFMKIDTDGEDLNVLRGSELTLKQKNVLGIQIEFQPNGIISKNSNILSNINHFMNMNGFKLFDLEMNRFSRSALPAPFVYELMAQTQKGALRFGDALYIRDLADLDYQNRHEFNISRDKMIKLIYIFFIHGLPDCAIELMIKRKDILKLSNDDLSAIISSLKSLY